MDTVLLIARNDGDEVLHYDGDSVIWRPFDPDLHGSEVAFPQTAYHDALNLAKACDATVWCLLYDVLPS